MSNRETPATSEGPQTGNNQPPFAPAGQEAPGTAQPLAHEPPKAIYRELEASGESTKKTYEVIGGGRAIAGVTSRTPMIFKNRSITVVTEILPDSTPVDDCTSKLDTQLWIVINQGGERWLPLARVISYTVYKDVMKQEGKKKPKPRFLALLGEPEGFTGNARNHENDDPTEPRFPDLKRILQILYRQDGTPRKAVALLEKELTEATMIHYIAEFEVDKEFRGGEGFSTMAMGEFCRVLSEVLFQGPIVLAPAPLDWALRDPQEAGAGGSWAEVKAKIVAFYEKCGFAQWHRADIGSEISVMGMMLGAAVEPAVESEDEDAPGEIVDEEW